MSLDGRISGPGGDMGWLDRFGGPDADMGYGAFYAGIDALVFGRATYDFVAAQPIDWPYSGKPSYVVTSRPLTSAPGEVIAVAPDFAALRARLVAAGHAHVWVMGGGRTQRGALDAGMFDDMRLFVMPVVLGGGAPLFTEGAMAAAALDRHTIHPGGIAELTYSFRGST